MEDDLFSQFGQDGEHLFNETLTNLDAIVASQQLELNSLRSQSEIDSVSLERRVQEQNNHIESLKAQIEKLQYDLQNKNGKISVIESVKENLESENFKLKQQSRQDVYKDIYKKFKASGSKNNSLINKNFIYQMKENSAQATSRALQNFNSTQFINNIDPNESVEFPSTQALISTVQSISSRQQSYSMVNTSESRYINNGNALWFNKVLVFFIEYLPSSTRDCKEFDLNSINYETPNNLSETNDIKEEEIDSYLKLIFLKLKYLLMEENEHLKQFNDKLFLIMDIREWNSKESKIDQLQGVLFKYGGFLNAFRNLIEKLIEFNQHTLCTSVWYIFTNVTATFTSFMPNFYNSGPVSIDIIPNLMRECFEKCVISSKSDPIQFYLIFQAIENILVQTPKIHFKRYFFLVEYLISTSSLYPIDFGLKYTVIYLKLISILIQDCLIFEALFSNSQFFNNFALLVSVLVKLSLNHFIIDNNCFEIIELIHSIMIKISHYDKQHLNNMSSGDLLLNIINWINFLFETTHLNFKDCLKSIEFEYFNELKINEFDTQKLTKNLEIFINSLILIFSTNLRVDEDNFELQTCLINLNTIMESGSFDLGLITKSEIRWLTEYFHMNSMQIDD